MEHRSSERYKVAVDVMLFQRGIPVVKARTGNVSLGGMLLHNGAGHFGPSELIEVEFAGKGGSCDQQRVPAMVVRFDSEDGLAVMFRDDEPIVRRLLAGIVEQGLSHRSAA